MRQSRLKAGGGNVLMAIRQKRAEAEAAGKQLLDLSIGEPKGPALLSAREAAREAVMSDDEVMHAYQYNDSPAVPGFAERFVAAHVKGRLPVDAVTYVPLTGVKPVLGLLPLACGCAVQNITVATTTKPGYPIPADWCDLHPLVTHNPLPLNVENQFSFATEDIGPDTDLVMMNYPHNPSGQIATTDWLHDICAYCQQHDIRLFNDAAYISLSHTEESSLLSDVAPNYPDLSWSEGFTAAKLIGNGTGWHVGALAGSPDFIDDVKIIKGKADAGLVPPMAAGALSALETDREGIETVRALYERRLNFLVDLFSDCGLRPAHRPRAGFFTLWEAPNEAFGEKITSGADFNFIMIDEVGLVGVHFSNFVRYAVCADVEKMATGLETALRQASLKYN